MYANWRTRFCPYFSAGNTSKSLTGMELWSSLKTEVLRRLGNPFFRYHWQNWATSLFRCLFSTDGALSKLNTVIWMKVWMQVRMMIKNNTVLLRIEKRKTICRGLEKALNCCCFYFFSICITIDWWKKKTLRQSTLLFTLNPSHMFALPMVDSLVR